MVRKLKRKERKLILRIIRGILFSVLGLIILLLLTTGYLFLNRDNISGRLLMSLSSYTRGELRFESIAFNPFIQFPSMSLLMREVEYYENPIENRNQNEIPLAKIEKLYAAIDVKELIQGRVDISKVLLERGRINLIQYPDSSLNLMNSIKSPDKSFDRDQEIVDTTVLNASSTRTNISDTTSESTPLEIILEHVLLEDIRFELDNRLEGNRASLEFSKLRAQFEYTPEAIRSNLETDIRLEYLQLANKEVINNSDIHLETSVVFTRKDLKLQLDPSQLIVDKAKLSIEGELEFGDDGFMDLKFSGSDDDFELSRLILSETGLRNFEKGDLYFRGTLKDNNLKGIPLLDIDFGINDLRLLIPSAGKYINNMNLSGKFNSGNRKDFSNAWVRIDTIYAELPEGHVNGSLFLYNFKDLELDLKLDLKADISGFDQVFNLPFVDSLSGIFRTSLIADGAKYIADSGFIKADNVEFDLTFDYASAYFPGIMEIDSLNGRIHHKQGITMLHDLEARVDDSDFLINGRINNPFYLVFGVDTVIKADLKIRSDLFDLPGFLDFVPVVKEAFPYRIRDVDLGVLVTTSTERFLQMRPNPSITFDIQHLEAEVENLLPPLSISQGIFELDHRNERTYLDFKDFKINIMESNLDVDLEYNSPAQSRTYLVMDIGVENLNPAKLIWDEETDTLPEVLNGLLAGSFLLDLHFPHDSIQTLKKIDLREADLLFINSKDTIQTKSLKILAEDIYIDMEKDPNPFASMTADLLLGSKQSSFRSYTWQGYDFNVEVRDGIYTVHPGRSRLFGKEGSGLFILDPFSEQPNYKIQYQVDQYEVKDLMLNFIEDTLLVGKMDLMIDVVLETKEDRDLLAGLNGQVLLKGQDLTLYGIDLDKLIRKFERSQNFNLVDLGAVMFMGPAGLVVSKGSSYADIIVSDYSENSPVTYLRSDIQFQDGRVLLNDPAFSTEENRVAGQGWMELLEDSLDITVAVVDQNGCSIIDQRMYGSMKDPEKSKVRFLGTILAPVTNLVQSALGNDCEPFYEGSVPHPEKK
jgi:hypothetical protein